ncbi:MAG: methionyl-tRNA formyltransferase [Rickettsiales bacterium]|nr:methionyl-tRNA formyltransferase [Rickettsiales bacterium]
MNIVFIGCVESSFVALKTLLAIHQVDVTGVVTLEKSAVNSDFCDITPLARAQHIPVFYDGGKERSDELVSFIRYCKADYVFCIGWSRLLPTEVLQATKGGVVGYHPTLLPLHRGRHPIIWAIVNGLEETGSSLFLMDEGADSGPLISQMHVAIEARETAASLYQKLLTALEAQLRDCVPKLAEGTLQPQPQDHSKATYWQKRGKDDGQLHWEKSAVELDRLVRALSVPYPGAHFLYRGVDVVVKESSVALEAAENGGPGQVLAKKGDFFLVKCGQNALWILPAIPIDVEIGGYLNG